MAYGLASSTNYFPFLDKNLRIEFARNPRRFALPRYTLMADCKKQLAYYTRIDNEVGLRIVGGSLYAAAWPDGSPRPDGQANKVRSDFQPIRLYRHSHNFPHGAMAVGQADYSVMQTNSYLMAMRAMTLRTLWAKSRLDAGCSSATFSAAIGGGGTKIGAGTVANPVFFIALQYAYGIINLATGGVVQMEHLCVVIPPVVAQALAASAEMNDFVARSSVAKDILLGGFNGQWGLPETYRGYRLIVDDTATISSNIVPGTVATKTYVYGSDDIYILARVDKNGGNDMYTQGPGFTQNEQYGDVYPSQFSTAIVFEGPFITLNKDAQRSGTYGMASESYVDIHNEIAHGGVRDNFGIEVTAAASGLILTDCL